MTGSKHQVTVDSTSTYWQAESYLYVRAILYGDEMETILRMRYDSYIGFVTTRTFNAQYAIPVHSNWYYKNGEIPADWYSSTSTEGWIEGNDSNFPDSSNQIQLYKKTFTVSDISNIAGFVISLRYKYGCIIYLNGHEAFRHAVQDATISNSTTTTEMYGATIYRQISLPIRTVQMNDTAAVNYIQQGSNTIAIGIVAINYLQKESLFDCALRLMGEERESRAFDYTVFYGGIGGNPAYVLSQYYAYSVYFSSESNYFTISFNPIRHEWINSVTIKLHYLQNSQQPRQFVIKAKNDTGEWITITTVTGLTWSQAGQAQTIYFQNNKAYQTYQFENFATGNSSDTFWKFNSLDLASVYTTMTIPELVYESTTIFKGIQMEEVYPNSEYYFNFQISPALPDGLSIDPNSGVISGIAKSEMTATSYSITATKLTGGTSTASFSLTVDSCTGGRSLVILVVRTDCYPEQSFYRLYEGIGTSGAIVRSIDRFMLASALNYAHFCLNDGIYTLKLFDAASDGWANPAGYYLTVDSGEMIFEMGQVPSGVTFVTTMFSTYIPFQIETTNWKISYGYVENWNTLEFDDSGWASHKASDIGANTNVTTYIHKEVNIPDISNYHVLNIRVKYAGGVAAYFNGRLVARFNLEENFDSNSYSLKTHDADSFSKFHVIMNTAKGETGRNLIAFEIHRPSNQSSADNVVFDATGVFGVNDCSIVVDSYQEITGTNPSEGSFSELFDLNPTTYGYQPNKPGTYLEWTVENLQGTKFNNFGMQTVFARTDYGFSISGIRFDSQNQELLQVTDQSIQALKRNVWSVPKGSFGYKQLRFEVDNATSDNVYVSSYMLLYCKPSGSGVCDGMYDYPSVGDGEISIGDCNYR